MRTDRNPVLDAAAREAPSGPGVYCALGDGGELVYVGKAASLSRRLQGWARGTTNPEDLRVHRLRARVREVRFIECTDEHQALCREADLIVALAPRFNAVMRDDACTFICVEDAVISSGATRLRFTMTENAATPAQRTYGAFPHLGKGKASWRAVRTNAGYSSLLRLLWLTFAGSRVRVRIPSKLRGKSPPVAQVIDVDASRASGLRPVLHDYLSGRSNRLLRTFAETVASDEVPPYMRGPLADDLQGAEQFFRLGPRALRDVRRRHGLPPGPVDQATFTAVLERELRAAIGPFSLSPRRPAGAALPRRIR